MSIHRAAAGPLRWFLGISGAQAGLLAASLSGQSGEGLALTAGIHLALWALMATTTACWVRGAMREG